jgi:hypothetical protein
VTRQAGAGLVAGGVGRGVELVRGLLCRQIQRRRKGGVCIAGAARWELSRAVEELGRIRIEELLRTTGEEGPLDEEVLVCVLVVGACCLLCRD